MYLLLTFSFDGDNPGSNFMRGLPNLQRSQKFRNILHIDTYF